MFQALIKGKQEMPLFIVIDFGVLKRRMGTIIIPIFLLQRIAIFHLDPGLR